MAFEWLSFLNARGIEYATSGPNVSRGHVAVKCPWCGAADPSQHMGISLEGAGWACWRNREHRGRKPARLVQALLNCRMDQAYEIVGGINVPSDFMSQVAAQLTKREDVAVDLRTLKMPKEFKPFRNLPSARPFIAYLKERGYTQKQILHMSETYDMSYCVAGPFKYRIIFPVIHKYRLISWVGRTISTSNLRYKALTVDPDKAKADNTPVAVDLNTNYVLWYDQLKEWDADTLVICEGPFDSLRVNELGDGLGIASTCVFTSSPSDAQIEILYELLPRFKRKYLMLDRGTLPTAMKILSRMPRSEIKIVELPSHLKDPGEMQMADLKNLDLAK